MRRSWLVAELGAALDYVYSDRSRMLALLALADGDLIDALAGRRRRELHERYAHFSCDRAADAGVASSICRHERSFPAALRRRRDAPHALYIEGRADRFTELTQGAVVAVVGSAHASDYGRAVARGLGRVLAASGVAVAASLCDGVCAAALAGAAEVHGPAICMTPGGLALAGGARRRRLAESVTRFGCALSELPCGTPARRWGQPAGERIVAAIAQVTVVVEARDTARELAPALMAQASGRVVAAVPGRVTSPMSTGAHALLAAEAKLVRGASDVLELLGCEGSAGATARHEPFGGALDGLPPQHRQLLERVGAGEDTPGRLTTGAADSAGVLLALSELEARGFLGRGDNGRYVVLAAGEV